MSSKSSKILIDLNVTIKCPECSAEFALMKGLAQKTIDQYESDFEKVVSQREEEVEEKVTKKIEAKVSKDLQSKFTQLEKQLEDSEKDLEKSQQNELELLEEKKAFNKAKKNLDLEVARKVEEQTKELETSLKEDEQQRLDIVKREYQKKLDDAEDAVREMDRKLRQGSVQLQGEILELKIEDDLAAAFPNDTVSPVKSGKRGADVIQEVISQSGKSCGKILYEVKRAQNWSSKWLDKLKEDQIAEGADHAVLATTALPKDATDAINFINGVWVIREGAVVVLAGMLRYSLLEVNKVKIAHTDRESKVELLYEYLNSPQFAQKLRVVADSFQKMNDDITRERAAMERLWSKREAEVKRVLMSMAGIVGDLQGYSQTSLPQLDDIKSLSLDMDDLE